MSKNKLNSLINEDTFNISDKSNKKGGKREKLDSKKPLNGKEKIDRKAMGAIAEAERQVQRDKTTEDSYSSELNTDLSFLDESFKIDKERTIVVDDLSETVNEIAATVEIDEPVKIEETLAPAKKINVIKKIKVNLEKDTESFGSDNVELNKKMEAMMADYEAEDTVDREPVIPSHILAEQKIESEKKSDDLFNTLYKDSAVDQKKDVTPDKLLLNSEELLDVLSQQSKDASLVETKNSLDLEQRKLLRKIKVLKLSETEKREMLNDITKHEPIAIEGQKNVAESSSELSGQESEPLIDTEKKEYEPSPLFDKFVLSKITSWSKENLESSLINQTIDRQEVKAWSYKQITGIVSFSSVGYSTYLYNWQELKSGDVVDFKSEKAIYSLVGPNGTVTHNNLSYQEAENLLWSESKRYLADLNLEFEENKEAIEKEFGSVESNQPENVDNNGEQNQEALKYAEKMGIDPEELENNKEFTELNSAQQQFVLEVLNRSSLYKIKVEAHQNFLAEKDSKKWYNLGFALNQKFHKQKHEVLAAQNIHEKGLEGYGETELSWLISIVKNGPEMKLDEDGDVDSVDYLKIEGDVTHERQELIKKYNAEVYYLTTASPSDEDYKWYVNDVKIAREALLADAEKDEDFGTKLVNRLIESEKQLKLHQFLRSDSKNEEIIQGLVDKSLGSWQKFGMMMGGQSDKAKYMGVGMGARVLLRSEIATSIIGKGMSYAIGPVVAAAMGAWRSNTRARAGLKEEAELSKIGITSDNKLVKSLNLAVGSKEEEGKVVNIGLADKIENLMAKCNALTAKANELEQTKTPDQESEFQNLKTEEMKLWERLSDRIEYTSQKMESGLVSFGEPAERAQNYYRLLNVVEEAKLIVFNEKYILNYQNRLDRTKTSSRVTELTRPDKKIKDIRDYEEFKNLKIALLAENLTPEDREKLEIEKQKMVRDWYRLDELNNLSVSDRLASFLNFKEDERQSAEFKYLVKETAKGAVMGATFAAVGAWIFEHTGLGNWTSHQLNNLSHAAHIDQAVNWTKGLFSSDDVSHSKVAEKVAATVAQEKVVDTASNSVPPATEVAEKVAPVPAPKIPEAAPENVVPKTYSEKISSESGKSNSVWRSLREIFKNNSQELGYKGDVNDTEALNRWSENQTANAVHNSGEVADKVFEGNKVSLVEENGQFKVNVEAGEGQTPDYLNVEKPPVIATEVPRDPGLKEMVSIKPSNISSSPIKINDLETPAVNNQGLINSMAKVLHVGADTLKSTGNEMIYQNKGGRIIFDTTKNVIKEVFDASNKSIPQEFVNELRGNNSLEKFASRGGLEKVFSVWNKLGANDKTVYESLHAFNLNKLTPFDLINKISGTFNVVAKDVMVDMDAKHFVLGNREFNMNLDGVNKLVRVLANRFGA